MKCSTPPPLSDEVLSLVLDGERDEKIQRHLDQCPACTKRLAEMRKIDFFLEKKLGRFECPPPQHLADYHTGMLDTTATEAVRQHIAQCPNCREELEMLTEFLNLSPEEAVIEKIIPLSSPTNVWTATHVQVSGSLALKGSDQDTAFDMKAGSASIFLESKAAPKGFLLTGQVVDSQINWVSAVGEAWQDGLLHQVHLLDDMCEFIFEFVTTTPITLYITSTSGITLIIGNINIQMQ
jgi:hypothetical protein